MAGAMKAKILNAQERLELITRTAQWCYDQTECWGHGRFGEGLAYLLWAIAANDGRPFDSTVCPEDFAELVKRGISLKGKIALARYGQNFRGASPIWRRRPAPSA